jgi:hypothetical protein
MLNSNSSSSFVDGQFVRNIVLHFIELNMMMEMDSIALGDLVCTLKRMDDENCELYTFDNFNKIRVFIPLARHIEKMERAENFNQIMSMNNTQVRLKDTVLDLMVSRQHDDEMYMNLVLFARDYEVIKLNTKVENMPNDFIDTERCFKDFLRAKRSDLQGLLNDFHHSILLSSRLGVYKITPNEANNIAMNSSHKVPDIKVESDNNNNISIDSGLISNYKRRVESYSIKKEKYVIPESLDIVIFSDL